MNIDPSVYDTLLSTGQQSANLDPQIAQQMAMAQRLRAEGQVPQGVRTGGMYGGRYVAPNKMAYLGALANQGVAQSKDQDVLALQQQQSDLRNQQVRAVLQALLKNGQLPPSANGAPPDMSGGSYGGGSPTAQGAING